jgi:hypothetical protein
MLAKNCSVGDILQMPDKKGDIYLFIVKRIQWANPNENEGVVGTELSIINGDSIEYLSNQFLNWANLGMYKKANMKKVSVHGKLIIRLLFQNKSSKMKRY